MRKFLLPGILAGLFLFLPSRSQAWPLDTPYQIIVDSTNAGSIIVSTTNFPSATASVNSNVVNDQWCITHLSVSAPGTSSTFTMFWATSTLTSGTTDYQVTTSTGVPYDVQWPYRTPYCAPTGAPILTLKDSNSGAQITVEGFLWKGWNP